MQVLLIGCMHLQSRTFPDLGFIYHIGLVLHKHRQPLTLTQGKRIVKQRKSQSASGGECWNVGSLAVRRANGTMSCLLSWFAKLRSSWAMAMATIARNKAGNVGTVHGDE